MAPKGVVRTTSSGSKEAWRNVYRFQLFPYLSRACLGKCSGFSINWPQKRRFRTAWPTPLGKIVAFAGWWLGNPLAPLNPARATQNRQFSVHSFSCTHRAAHAEPVTPPRQKTKFTHRRRSRAAFQSTSCLSHAQVSVSFSPHSLATRYHQCSEVACLRCALSVCCALSSQLLPAPRDKWLAGR